MKVFVDSDACPVKYIILDIGNKYNVELIFVSSLSHYTNFYRENGVEAIIVDNVSQSADMVIINRVRKGDIVVTGDYGLAALALGKGAYAISFHGKIFNKENIDSLLYRRHLTMKAIRKGGRVKGPQKRNERDDIAFKKSLEMLIKKGR